MVEAAAEGGKRAEAVDRVHPRSSRRGFSNRDYALAQARLRALANKGKRPTLSTSEAGTKEPSRPLTRHGKLEQVGENERHARGRGKGREGPEHEDREEVSPDQKQEMEVLLARVAQLEKTLLLNIRIAGLKPGREIALLAETEELIAVRVQATRALQHSIGEWQRHMSAVRALHEEELRKRAEAEEDTRLQHRLSLERCREESFAYREGVRREAERAVQGVRRDAEERRKEAEASLEVRVQREVAVAKLKMEASQAHSTAQQVSKLQAEVGALHARRREEGLAAQEELQGLREREAHGAHVLGQLREALNKESGRAGRREAESQRREAELRQRVEALLTEGDALKAQVREGAAREGEHRAALDLLDGRVRLIVESKQGDIERLRRELHSERRRAEEAEAALTRVQAGFTEQGSLLGALSPPRK